MKTKKGEFIEVDYTGFIKSTNQIFDLTNEKVAKDNKLFNQKATYGPVVICLGQNEILPGLDKSLIDKETAKEYTINLSAEEAFGKKDPKLMKLIPLNKFREQKINPFPGLQINMDGIIGKIRSVSGGRVIMDFNHPLAGQELIYKVKIIRILTELKEKLDSIVHMHFDKDAKIELKGQEANITSKIPKELNKKVEERIRSLLPELKKIEFESDKPIVSKTTDKK